MLCGFCLVNSECVAYLSSSLSKFNLYPEMFQLNIFQSNIEPNYSYYISQLVSQFCFRFVDCSVN